MPRKVTAWSCSFGCGRRVVTDRTSMEKHEKTCFNNPDRRACRTCKYQEIRHEPVEDKIATVESVRYCEIGKLPAGKFIVFDCQSWQEREDF